MPVLCGAAIPNPVSEEKKSNIKGTAVGASISAMERSSHREDSQKRELRHEYSGVKAISKALQLNGDFRPETASINSYENVRATEGGRQVNGHAQGPKASEPSRGHSFHNMEASGTGSWQVNGNIAGNTTMQDVQNFMMTRE